MTFSQADALEGIPEEVQHSAVGPMIGVAAIALNMAMKYHDIATVRDGQLYQQYKLEGKNMVPLHLDMVFHTAMQIEAHLIAANSRVAKLIAFSVLDDIEAHGSGQEAPQPETPAASSDSA